MRKQKTEELSKEQILLITKAILNAGADRASLLVNIAESDPDLYERELSHLVSFCNGAKETVGMTLACLFASITGDGLGIGDALDISGFPKVMEKWEKATLRKIAKKKHKNRDLCHPDMTTCAKKFAQFVQKERNS